MTPGRLSDAALRIGIAAEPPTLDWHFTTVAATYSVAWNIFESLVAPDRGLAPKPMLAESWETSPDGRTYTFKLRKGVQFHNGREMKAEDVVASLRRWMELSRPAEAVKSRLTSLSAKDDYTVEVQLTSRFSSFLILLAAVSQSPAVMPKEIVEKAGKDKLNEFIGTGPYRFVEWQPDVHIKLTRFDDYKPVAGEASGNAGGRIPYAKDLFFMTKSDQAARLSALLAGDLDIAKDLSLDHFQTLKSRSDVTPHLQSLYRFPYIGFNFRTPLGGNLKFRQAVAAAVDAGATMAPFGPSDLWKLSSSYEAHTRWATDAGKDVYNQNNPAKAKQLLQEAGYNGEPVGLIWIREDTTSDKPAQALTSQLTNVGIRVEAQPADTATFVARRSKGEGWVFWQGWSVAQPDPGNHPFWSGRFDGGFKSDAVDRLRTEYLEAPTFEDQYKAWEKMERQVWTELPMIKNGGDLTGLHGTRSNITGWNDFIDVVVTGLQKT